MKSIKCPECFETMVRVRLIVEDEKAGFHEVYEGFFCDCFPNPHDTQEAIGRHRYEFPDPHAFLEIQLRVEG